MIQLSRIMLWSVFKRSGDTGSREENPSKVKASVLIQSEPKGSRAWAY